MKIFWKFLSPFWRLGRQYNKFWILASFSILVGLIPIIVNTKLFSEQDICEKTDNSQLKQDQIAKSNRCRLTNAGIALAWALLTSSLTQILTGVAQIWSIDEDQSEFDCFFGLDSSNMGKEKNSIAFIIPKFPMKYLQTAIENALKTDTNIFQNVNDRDQQISQLASKVSQEIQSSNLTTEKNVIKKLSEVKEAVLAEADVKAVASISSLFGMKGFFTTDIIQDDTVPFDIKDSYIKINGKQYKTIFVVGLFSNNFLNVFKNESLQCFKLKITEKEDERDFTIEEYEQDCLKKGKEFEFIRALDTYKEDNDETSWGLIAKTIYKETSIIFIGGISAEGTVAVGEFLENDWKHEKPNEHLLFNTVSGLIGAYNGLNKRKKGFKEIKIWDKVNFAISIKLTRNGTVITPSIERATFKPSK